MTPSITEKIKQDAEAYAKKNYTFLPESPNKKYWEEYVIGVSKYSNIGGATPWAEQAEALAEALDKIMDISSKELCSQNEIYSLAFRAACLYQQFKIVNPSEQNKKQ